MRKIILLLLLFIPFISNGQRMTVVEDNGWKYLAVYAYGLPREVVKKNSEIIDSKFDGGIMRRHHTTKSVDAKIGDEGYNGNQKISFAFLIAPQSVNESGEHIHDDDYIYPTGYRPSEDYIPWYKASGWDKSVCEETPSVKGYTTNKGVFYSDRGDGNGKSEKSATPTGCAAYTGPLKKDPLGSWRLPTQREAQIMFTVIEQALTLIHGKNKDLIHHIMDGNYWTSTEFFATGNTWQAWYIESSSGKVLYGAHLDAFGNSSTAFARCVRDIDNDEIND